MSSKKASSLKNILNSSKKEDKTTTSTPADGKKAEKKVDKFINKIKDNLKKGYQKKEPDPSRFSELDDLNDFLEAIPDWMDKFVKNLEGLAQDKVDEKCIEVCLIVNGKLEQLKKAAVKKLKNRYIKSQKVIQIIEPLTKPPTDLGSVIDYCTGLVSYFTGPYQELISFVSELAPRIVETGQNLQRIASYRPPKVSIKIKTNCLKLIAPSLSLGDILG